MRLLLFQFHKGTIRTVPDGLIRIDYFRFNSIKVRLEQTIPPSSKFGATMFQFHKGTIRTSKRETRDTPPLMFQFHKGTIRTPLFAEIANRTSVSIP